VTVSVRSSLLSTSVIGSLDLMWTAPSSSDIDLIHSICRQHACPWRKGEGSFLLLLQREVTSTLYKVGV